MSATARSEVLDRLFGIDLRSLAALRIGVAGILLVDLALRAPQLGTFYTDAGVLTRELLRSPWAIRYPASLHMLSGELWAVGLLFAMHAAAASALLVGHRTRLAGLLTWLLTISMYTRNPFTLYGGSLLLALLLFWGLFTPWGACWSIDARRGRGGAPGARVRSVGTLALLLQMPFVYFFTSVLKTGTSWDWNELTAVYYALNSEIATVGIGPWLAGLPLPLLQAATAFVVVVERVAPFALFSPLATGRTRIATIAALSVMQLGFFFCLTVGIFPFVSTVALLPFVPGRVWDRLGLPATTQTGRPERRPGKLAMALCALVLAFAVYDNLRRPGWLPSWRIVERVSHTLWLRQNWDMFAPEPPRYQPWFVAKGRLDDGETVFLLNGGAERVSEKPASIAGTFPSILWLKYQQALSSRRAPPARALFLDYLCREWNRGPEARGRLRELDFYNVRQPIDRGGPVGQPRVRRLARHECPPEEPARAPRDPLARDG